MKPETVLWGRKPTDPEWAEQLITSTCDKEHLRKAREWATANGFTILRESVFDGSRPDFRKAIKV